MASGHRKRKAGLLRSEVLDPIGLTNLPASEAGNTTNLNNVMNNILLKKNKLVGFAITLSSGVSSFRRIIFLYSLCRKSGRT